MTPSLDDSALQAAVPRLRRAWPHLADLPDDLTRALLPGLPFTTKADLHAGYPLGRLGVPPEQLRRIHASSGTSGTPTLVAYTAADLRLWQRLVARGLEAIGLRAGDRAHSALGHGLFTGGLGFHAAGEALGLCMIPAGAGETARHRQLIAALQPRALFATPGYALHLAQPGRLHIELGVFGAEPLGDGLRARLEAAWGMRAYDTYGLSEAIGPGVGWECLARAGLHLNDDAFLPEIIDPATGQPLPDGQEGELVLTAPLKEALPLLRYRTGDRTVLTHAPCPCGRPGPRLLGIRGRVDGMLVVRGVNLFPGQIEAALLAIPEACGPWRLTVRRPEALDTLHLAVEVSAPASPGLAAEIGRRVRDILGLSAEVQLCPPGTLDAGLQGKVRRIVDLRAGATGVSAG